MNTLTTEQEIRGAMARGYCTKENENKVLDPELIEAMALEVEKVFKEDRNARAREVEKGINEIVLEMEQIADEIDRKSNYSRKLEYINLVDFIDKLLSLSHGIDLLKVDSK